MVIEAVINTETCTDTPIILQGVNCDVIENCAQTVCYDGSQNYVWCGQCENLYYPINIKEMDSIYSWRATGCEIGGNPTIVDCFSYESIGQSQDPVCSTCNSGYVAVWNQTECVANKDTTENCAVLQHDSEFDCYACWWGYVFNNNVCVLLADGLKVGFLVMGSIFLVLMG